MRIQSSAFARIAVAVRKFWQDTVYLQECLLERPWEQEGELRWQRDFGGPKLIGRALDLSELEVSGSDVSRPRADLRPGRH
jgi:hypothetical protein